MGDSEAEKASKDDREPNPSSSQPMRGEPREEPETFEQLRARVQALEVENRSLLEQNEFLT